MPQTLSYRIQDQYVKNCPEPLHLFYRRGRAFDFRPIRVPAFILVQFVLQLQAYLRECL